MDFIGKAGVPEFIVGTEGNDRMYGQPDDLLDARGGDDILAGAERMYGGIGNDQYYIQENGTGQQVVEYANQGTDMAVLLLDPSSGHFTLPDNVENIAIITGSTAIGNGQDNTMYGNGDTNFLVGLGGSDTLVPGLGVDYMVGGPESDTFALSSAGNIMELNGDVITDWTDDRPHVAGDVFDLSTSNDVWNFIGNAGFRANGEAEISIEEVHRGNEGSTLVEFDANGDGVPDAIATLNGIHHLNDSDFIL
jgi:Ca2+-binding RTX toxin-like protein